MHENEFLTEPPRVVLYDPVKNVCEHVYVYIGAVPKTVAAAIDSKDAKKLRDHYGARYQSVLLLGADPETALLPEKTGGAEEADFSDIESLLAGPPRAAQKPPRTAFAARKVAAGVTYVRDYHLFPEDKFIELKEKIYLTTGIPPYRQHLFYMDHGRAVTTYMYSADGVYPVDIRKAMTFADNIYGIPVDKTLYESRDRNRVDALDSFRLIGDTGLKGPLTFYVVDLNTFTSSVRTQMEELLHDPFQFEILYHGFISLFYPMLTPECFRDYISGEAEFAFKYPDLTPNVDTLLSIYNTERNIINNCYHNAAAAERVLRGFGVSITQMTAMISGGAVQVNIRNLFDRLRMSRFIPEIHAYVEHGGKHYMLRKTHARNGSAIPFPAGLLMKNGVTIAVSLRAHDQDTYHAKSSISTMENEQNRYLFLNIQPNGVYYIRTVWNEEDEFGFEEIIRVMKKFVDPVISGINKLGRMVFVSDARLQPITKANLSYHSLNICVFYRRIMSDGVFKMLKQFWEKYIQSRIFSARNIQQGDKYELLFRKGVHQFDTTLIKRIMSASSGVTLLNQYAYLSNNTVKQKWNQNYDGRIVRMVHRTTDVKFEVVDIREDDFAYFLTYLSNFILGAMADPAINAAITASKSYKDVRKLKKLREQDPELYNLKKHGSNRIYSILCQNPRQPLIYTPEEIASLPPAQVKKLTEYWNFTLNRPAYYGCPSSTYPHLSFITGVHPKNYCLPCCNKKESSAETSKKYKIANACLRDRKFAEEDTAEFSRHVMGYGKNLDAGRLSRVPNIVRNLLFGTYSGQHQYYVYGVPQHMPGVENVGILFSAAAALDMTPENLAEMIAGRLHAMPMLFNMLLYGSLPEFFASIDALSASIRELFVEHKMFSRESQKFTQWPGLFTEILHELFAVSTFTFIDENVDGNATMYVDDKVRAGAMHTSNNKYIILVKQRNKYYPIFLADTSDYFNAGKIERRTFDHSDDAIKVLNSAVKFSAKLAENRTGMTPDLGLLINFAAATGRKITKCYINRQNLCYAAAIDGVYFPCEYSSHSGMQITFEALSRADAPQHKEVLAVVEALNKYISEYHKTPTGDYKYHKITPGDYFGRALPEGFRAGRLVFYFAAEKVVPSHTIVQYDYLEINAAIMARAPSAENRRVERLSEALYTNYLYQLFVAEFVSYINNERNEQVRGAVRDLIKSTNFRTGINAFRNKIAQLLADYPEDLVVVQGLISVFYTGGMSEADLIARFSEGLYDFDRVTIRRLRAAPRDKVAQILGEIVGNFAVERDFDTRGMTFSNVYVTCGDDNGAKYCDGKRLVVNRPLAELVDLLAADFTNELKAKYLLNSAVGETYVSFFDFMKLPTEVIVVYHLTK